ncbi:MAG: META domain-containing protein [Acidimicrobiia bacterium]|nr:META domain-containing protein [Acidimicrobiia bacterium]
MKHRNPTWTALLLIAVVAGLVSLTACGDDTTVAGDDDSEPSNGSGSATAGSETGVSLAGTWELTELVVAGTPVTLPPAPLRITIADGEIGGDAGCNSFSGTIDRVDDGSLAIGPLTQTEMACEHLDFEVAYTSALLEATTWEATPDNIAFVADRARITYRPVAVGPSEAAPLAGTVWVLDTVYGPGEGPQRAVSTIDMSAPGVELVFGADTATVVSEPCTDAVYQVTYVEDEGGGSLQVEGGGAVQCEGMESENPNHDVATGALSAATGYLLDGDRLILIGEEGELIGFIARNE